MARKITTLLAAWAVATLVFSAGAAPQASPARASHPRDIARPSTRTVAPGQHDGTHDFDFNVGTWHTHIRSLQHPLTGSPRWVEFDGTVVEQKIYAGAMLEHIQASGPAGHFEGLTLFLYNPHSHQWSQTYAGRDTGTMESPAIGEFSNGRGELISQEPYQGQIVLVRAVWSDITPDSHRFELDNSYDSGKTWKPNFMARLTRIKQ